MENEITFAALRCHFQTGRSYVISGEGRNRVYGFRSGVQCDLGDIEKSEWIRMVKEEISRQGEEELHQQLLQHLKDQNYAKSPELRSNSKPSSIMQPGSSTMRDG